MEERAAKGSVVRVLMVRFSAIGDCVMAAHTATCIRRSDPAGFLVWAVEQRCAAVVDEDRLVDHRAVFLRDQWKQRAWTPRTWREQWAYFKGLREERFEIGIDLQGHSKTALCLRLSGAKRRLAVRATDPIARRLNPQFQDFGEARHTVDRQLSALRSLGQFEGAPSPPIMPALVQPRLAARERVGPEPFEVIAVGAGQAQKAYPTARWAQVAQSRIASGRRIVFVGGPEESAPQVSGAFDLVGRLTLEETMALLAEATAVMAADTGAGHLAAAFEVPIVSVFGPTDPEEFRPYGAKGVVLRRSQDPGDVAPEEIIQAVESLCGS